MLGTDLLLDPFGARWAELRDRARWLEPGSAARERLAGLGVQRLVLLVPASADPALIQAAGRLLSGPC